MRPMILSVLLFLLLTVQPSKAEEVIALGTLESDNVDYRVAIYPSPYNPAQTILQLEPKPSVFELFIGQYYAPSENSPVRAFAGVNEGGKIMQVGWNKAITFGNNAHAVLRANNNKVIKRFVGEIHEDYVSSH